MYFIELLVRKFKKKKAVEASYNPLLEDENEEESSRAEIAD